MSNLIKILPILLLFTSFESVAQPPVGKTINWELKKIKSIYEGKPKSTILTVFGKPDRTLGSDTWIYENLKITEKVSGLKYTKAYFNFFKDKVYSVSCYKD